MSNLSRNICWETVVGKLLKTELLKTFASHAQPVLQVAAACCRLKVERICTFCHTLKQLATFFFARGEVVLGILNAQHLSVFH